MSWRYNSGGDAVTNTSSEKLEHCFPFRGGNREPSQQGLFRRWDILQNWRETIGFHCFNTDTLPISFFFSFFKRKKERKFGSGQGTEGGSGRGEGGIKSKNKFMSRNVLF